MSMVTIPSRSTTVEREVAIAGAINESFGMDPPSSSAFLDLDSRELVGRAVTADNGAVQEDINVVGCTQIIEDALEAFRVEILT